MHFGLEEVGDGRFSLRRLRFAVDFGIFELVVACLLVVLPLIVKADVVVAAKRVQGLLQPSSLALHLTHIELGKLPIEQDVLAHFERQVVQIDLLD